MKGRIYIYLLLAIAFIQCGKTEPGCQDPKALNYEPNANALGVCVYMPDTTTPKAKVMVVINPIINGQQLKLETTYKDQMDRNITFSLFKYYVSNLKFSNLKADKYDVCDVELIDYDVPVANSSRPTFDHIIEGEVRVDQYNGIYLGLGVDPIKNEEYKPNDYPTEHPLNVLYNNMDWTWASKYKFFSVEGKIDSSSVTEKAFFIHTGFSDLYRQQIISLKEPFQVKENMTTVVTLQLEVDKLFEGIDLATGEGQSHTENLEKKEISRKLQTNLAKYITFKGVEYQ